MPDTASNIYLIGYRGTGKSTIGRKLAILRGLGFADTDERIQDAEQKSISRIVADRGWPHFRKLEKACLRQLAAKCGFVIATGGGIILHPDNIACMQSKGKVIWLRATHRTILERLQQDPATTASRPALTRQAFAEEVRTTLEARRKQYRRAADLSVRTDGVPPDDIVARIQALLAGAPKS